MPGTRPEWGIFGNEAAVRHMRRAVSGGPRHAYMLSGPASVGKSLLATSFAAALLCPSAPVPGESCGQCSTCRRVLKGVHPDVTRFDLAYQAAQDDGGSKNLTLNIGTVRDIGRHVSLRPVEAAWRVVVVGDVETMQEPAQEAFLKTLEEPPPYVVILMLCADSELMLPTVRSRCAILPMALASDSVVIDALTAHGADRAVAERVSVATRGRVGLALRALGDMELLDGLTAHVDAATSWVAADAHGRMVEGFRLADQLSSGRDTVFDRLLAVQAAWRELLLSRSGLDGRAPHPVTLRGSLADVEGGVRALLAVDRCIRDLEANVRPRAAVATMVSAWPELHAP